MRRKIEMGKFDKSWGTIELTEEGGFRFDGPKAEFMRQWMRDIQNLRFDLKGEEAMRAFAESFPHASYWFKDVP